MSSGNASSDMAQKKIDLKLDSNNLIIRGDTDVNISLDEPKINVGKLYESVFSGIDTPTKITVDFEAAITRHSKAQEIAKSIKIIIDEASEAINSELPNVIASLDEKSEVDDKLDQDLSAEDDFDISQLF